MHRLAFLVIPAALALYGAEAQKTIKKVPVTRTSPASAQEMFRSYCAVCHGVEAKGNGPAVAALKVPPPDLTRLSANNGGKFPELRVFNSINGEANLPAHGSSEMPVWGTLFREMRGDSSQAALRLRNLTKYIEQLQTK
jgi:mono/diheme cytochrome c family protein